MILLFVEFAARSTQWYKVPPRIAAAHGRHILLAKPEPARNFRNSGPATPSVACNEASDKRLTFGKTSNLGSPMRNSPPGFGAGCRA